MSTCFAGKDFNDLYNKLGNIIIGYNTSNKPIYTKTTNYGHFGKKDLPWENIIDM